MTVERTDIRLYANDKRVLLRYLNLGEDSSRIQPILDHILTLTDNQVKEQLAQVFQLYDHRHFDFREKLVEHFQTKAHFAPEDLSDDRKLLCGSYFTHEYSVEASALFNPSIVQHPNQENLKLGGVRFIMSLRSTGEGHISSISFLEGEIGQNGEIYLEPPYGKISGGIKEDLENFYKVNFREDQPISSHVLFPIHVEESMGMEDVRLVRLEDEGLYVGTYTAYDGRNIKPKYFTTSDFHQFEIRAFEGSAARNKGMALFPEKINGKYVMIGRQDGRSLTIMYSENLQNWNKAEPLQEPQRAWEMLQIGNNGSPIRTEAGWLLLTHGVGPMRRYTLSLTLLDLKNPSKVIGSLEQPLMEPNEEEREGYVPNVLYTCGMLLHNNMLIIPYAMSDSAIGFAKVSLAEVIKKLTL